MRIATSPDSAKTRDMAANPKASVRVISPALVESCLYQATLAPSSHNTQPWRFRVRAEDIELIADRTRALPVNDPFDRELTISCGAALFNLRVAAAAAGLDALVEPLPVVGDPDVLARITLATGTGRRLHDAAALDAALPRRRTYRRKFLTQAVERSQIDALCAAAREEGARLAPVDTESLRAAAADLIGEADVLLWGDVQWRRELASWMHPQRRNEGFGIPGMTRPAAELIVRSFDMGEGVAARDAQLLHGSPLIAVLGTESDDASTWLRAGQALERVLLRACADGLQASFLNQPVVVPAMRKRLQALIPTVGRPQIILRLGYPATDLAPVDRRPLDEVIQADWPLP
jgi:nitroreductase